MDNNCTGFVGDLSPVVSGSGTGFVEWAPDELRAKTGNNITIKYVDEVQPAVSKRDEAKSEVPKQDEDKLVVPKQDEAKSEVPKQDEDKLVVPKQDEAKLVVPKQDEVKSVVSKQRFLGRLFHTHS